VNRVKLLFLLLLPVSLFVACSNNLSPEVIEYQQAYNAGKAYYHDACAKCHQEDGSGLGTLYPPLSNSDYLLKNPDKLACIIYNGMKGPVIVNDKQFNWAMPGHVNMDDYELACLLTYVKSHWGGINQRVTIDQARAMIIDCRTSGKP
jgi:cytochrome c551